MVELALIHLSVEVQSRQRQAVQMNVMLPNSIEKVVQSAWCSTNPFILLRQGRFACWRIPARRASFDVALCFHAPNGAATRKPRASPWGFTTTPFRDALKGHDKDRLDASKVLKEHDPSEAIEDNVRPFQGRDSCRYSVPRAMPWADLWLPRSGRNSKSATSKHQNWRVGLVYRPGGCRSVRQRRAGGTVAGASDWSVTFFLAWVIAKGAIRKNWCFEAGGFLLAHAR